MKKIIYVKICDVGSLEEYVDCPNCESKDATLVEESSGPLTEWTLCRECFCWFHPEVEFKEGE